jgi:hypothetical protein
MADMRLRMPPTNPIGLSPSVEPIMTARLQNRRLITAISSDSPILTADMFSSRWTGKYPKGAP